MRLLALLSVVILAGCDAPGGSSTRNAQDETQEAWYGQTVGQLAELDRQAESSFQSGHPDQAAALIEKGQPLMKRVISVRQPTLAALEAASDLDHLYGRMLLANRHYGWARLLFQKNLARWKHREPQTEEIVRRRQQAESAIAECDRHIDY